MNKLILITLLTFIGTSAHADKIGIIINGKSIHLDDRNWNEENWGTGVHYEFETKDNWTPFFTASGFIDSVNNNSYVVGVGNKRRIETLSTRDDTFHVELGATAFLMTRKDYRDNKPFFGVLPILTLGSGPLDLNITYVPAVDPKLIPLLFFQAVYKFDLK